MQMPDPGAGGDVHAPTLCARCAFMRPVHGRRGQRYLLCSNRLIAARYPVQPVSSCVAYTPADTSPAA